MIPWTPLFVSHIVSDIPSPGRYGMRRISMLSCAALLGCASAGVVPPGSGPQETIRISGGAGLPMSTVDTRPTDATSTSVVGFALDRVWPALRAAYDSVGVPVSTFDVTTRTIGNTALRVRRRLGDTALSKYINCGNTQGGNGADTYEVIFSVVTRAVPAESGTTRLTTLIDAQGRPITIGGEYTRCTSTGALEKRLGQLVTSQLNR
jgi:hypothetical protein